MKRLLAALLLFLFSIPYAQLVETKKITTDATCSVSISSIVDAEMTSTFNYQTSNFFAYVSNGCKANVLDLSTMTTETPFDLDVVGVKTSSTYAGIQLLKNFLASDGKWSAIYTDYSTTAQAYQIAFIHDGKKQVISESAKYQPTIVKSGSGIFVIVHEKNAIRIFLARNDLTSPSRLNKGLRKASKTINPGLKELNYNAAGQLLGNTEKRHSMVIMNLRK